MNYFITAIYDEPGLFVHRKDKRTFGYFNDLILALIAVEENKGNLHECLYNYLVIEGIREGIHAKTEEEYWYQWQKDHWKKLKEKPEFLKGIVNFALG